MIFRSLALLLTSLALYGQPLDPAKLLQQPTDTWPTFNGDYSGRRFSPLKQINAKNVRNLTLAWSARADVGPGLQIKGTPLEINGVLYYTLPDHTWAIDARTGRQLWHFKWETTGGIHIGNRGVGVYGNWLFFETPDNFLVSLDKNTGKLRWSVEIADVKQQYFSTPRRSWSEITCSSVSAAIRSTCQVFSRLAIRKPEKSNGVGIARRGPESWVRTRGQTLKPWGTAEG
jgi:glucose dehydrogenase